MGSDYLFSDLTYKLRGIFFEVYNELGPGLNEKNYQRAIISELEKHKIDYEVEMSVDILYKGLNVGRQRLDLLVDNKVIIEIKAVDFMHPLFEKQTLAYIKATGYKLALLVNFGGNTLLIKRYINTIEDNKLSNQRNRS